MANPTIVLIPGAWHQPSCYDIVRDDLVSRGYDVEYVSYPTVGAEPPNKGLADDAAATRAVLERLADEGKQIVLGVHSYGGLVGANAVEGLGYKQRAKEGKKGGVTMFVYISAFVNPKGVSILNALGNAWLPWMQPSNLGDEMGTESGYVHISNPEDVMYHDVEPELQKKAVADLHHQSSPVFHGKVTYEPWHEIDCAYFVCEEDKALPVSIQDAMIGALGDKTLTFRFKTSHSPFLSKPKDVTDALIAVAKAGQERVSV
ncbi:Alpha/beta hydrolase fold-1 [Pestalotiopsis sp. NC0098]|nr:Alpha/beta hydrolase fold-1 [Pestalotiopsis sp. NC0098]